MPVPLTNLDVRRWGDLVDEGTALVPRFAPEWDEHNASDPGITLLELLAWLVEQDLYRVNRVPERHRRKFVALLGFPPRAPRGARAAVAVTPVAGAPPFALPAGVALAASVAPGAPPLRFRTLAELRPAAARVAAVQTFDGRGHADVTAAWSEALAFDGWGREPVGFGSDDAARAPALLVGFDGPLPAGAPLSMWIRVIGGADGDAQRAAVRAEAEGAARACLPARPRRRCEPDEDAPAPAPDPWLTHHSLQTIWEQLDGGVWSPLPADDRTRALTLDGPVVLTPVAAGTPEQVGAVPTRLRWVRCRVAGGRPDQAPALLEVSVNAVEAEQASAVREAFTIAPDASAPAVAPAPGARVRLDLAFTPDGRLSRAGADGGDGSPEALVLDYAAPAGGRPGRLMCTLALVGRSSGAPLQRLHLPAAPVTGGAIVVWSLEPAGPVRWEPRDDLDSSGAGDDVFTLDAEAGLLRFGDGRRGRVPPADAPMLAAYDVTAGAHGNAPATATWSLAGADDDLDRALLQRDPLAAQAAIAAVRSAAGASGGAAAEDVLGAAGRAAEEQWAHERLVELAPEPGGTLDGLDPATVRTAAVPARAATALDVERLALAVPGTRVRRARAWAALDPQDPCRRAPGLLTVVIVPGWPADRPEPGDELLFAVRRFLRRRRTLGTRLEVTGPRYVELGVRAQVRLLGGRSADAVGALARAAIAAYLHPLDGGRAGHGWPFGRDVRRTEVLAALDAVDGVDHVLELELTGSDGAGGCGDVCVGPLSLPALTGVEVEAVA